MWVVVTDGFFERTNVEGDSSGMARPQEAVQIASSLSPAAVILNRKVNDL